MGLCFHMHDNKVIFKKVTKKLSFYILNKRTKRARTCNKSSIIAYEFNNKLSFKMSLSRIPLLFFNFRIKPSVHCAFVDKET